MYSKKEIIDLVKNATYISEDDKCSILEYIENTTAKEINSCINNNMVIQNSLEYIKNEKICISSLEKAFKLGTIGTINDGMEIRDFIARERLCLKSLELRNKELIVNVFMAKVNEKNKMTYLEIWGEFRKILLRSRDNMNNYDGELITKKINWFDRRIKEKEQNEK